MSKRAIRLNASRKRQKEGLERADWQKNEFQFSAKIYVNGVEIENLCHFCERAKAVLHCPSCADFLCEECDFEIHRHEKRAEHVRTLVPQFSAPEAALKIVGMFRFAACRAELLRRCRESMTRYYDPKTRSYYYSDSRKITTWQQPICLRGMPLTPFPNFETCAFRIQSMFRYRRGRGALIELVCHYYEKIWSREHGQFYYVYNGRSRLVPKATWTKPRFLYWRNLKPLKTIDIAALLIQSQWNAYKSRQFLLDLIRSRYSARKDQVSGRHVYTRLTDGKRSTQKPPLFGPRDEWDPDDISLWNVAKLSVWIRRLLGGRLGKRIAANLFKFNIDGALLLAFEWSDYVDLGISQAHRIKHILLDIEKRSFFAAHQDTKRSLAKLQRLRYHHKVERACIVIQARYRMRLKRRLCEKMKDAAKLVFQAEQRHRSRIGGQFWWSNKMHLVKVRENNKCFGNYKVQRGVYGPGHYSADGKTWIPAIADANEKLVFPEIRPTNSVLKARGLRFYRNVDATVCRQALFKKLNTESFTAMAARGRLEN